MKTLCGMLLFAVLILCVPAAFYGDTGRNVENSSAKGPNLTGPAAPETPAEFFARARQLSDLEAAGVPFHLKIAFKATGKTEFTGDGTYEEWWKSKNVWRKEATLGKYKYVAVHNGQEKAASATSAYIPLRVRQVEGFKVFDISLKPEEEKKSWTVSQMHLNGALIHVVGSRERCEQNWEKSAFCVEEYSFNQQDLLVGYRDNDLFESFSDFHPFANLQFPGTMTIALRGHTLLTARVSALEKLSDPAKNLFDSTSIPDFGSEPSIVVDVENDPKLRSKGVTPPKLIDSRSPKYPLSARLLAKEGTVVVECTVDTSGKVREPFILLSGGKAFDDAALHAVRKYKFKPATKDRRAAMVPVKIIVAFHLRNP